MSLEHAWPRDRLGEGLYALARRAGYPIVVDEPPESPGRADDLNEWVDAAAKWMGVESVAMNVPHPELSPFLRSASATVVGLDPEHFLLVVSSGARALEVLGQDGRLHRVARESVARALDQSLSSEAARDVETLFESLPLKSPAKARARMVAERLSTESFDHIWLLRPTPAESVYEDIRRARLPELVSIFAAAFLIDFCLFVASWWLIGRGALRGQIDAGWLTAWALLFATMVPFRMISTWYEGRVAVAAGGLLKQRLLIGAMRLDPDETRHDGVGKHLARVLESETIETLAMSGGLTSAAASLQLIVSAVVVGFGSGGWIHASLLLATMGACYLVGRRYFLRRRDWTRARLKVSHDVVERMVGHRTRIAQLTANSRHEREDVHLVSYLQDARRADRLQAVLSAFPRMWLPIAVFAFAPGFILGVATLGQLAVAIGGTLLAYRALHKLVDGLSELLDAVITWERIRTLFLAAGRTPHRGDPNLLSLSRRQPAAPDGHPWLEANELSYRYANRAEPAIQNTSFTINTGDRILLTSPSGGGKSTLISLLNGIRKPSSGGVFIEGVDRQSLGDDGWTRRVATAPQFHENHVFTEVFAFNVLMGRRWPPERDDWREAESLCRDLGLGELLDKMPGGMNQLIGDTGWRLSHGEQSRVFLARALLQDAPLVMLDESFAALDPDSLTQALGCARDNAKSLVVIAHP